MKKKITNEEIGQYLGKLAEQIRDEMDLDLRIAYGQMMLAENDLASTFNDEQRSLYADLCQKRDAFYKIAGELYQRKY